MKNINDYPWSSGDAYEVANWLNDADSLDHQKYNSSAEATKAAQLMRDNGWTFLTYNEYGQEVWQKPGANTKLDGFDLAIKE